MLFKSLFTVILFISLFSLNAQQEDNHLDIVFQIPTKISVGKPSYQRFDYGRAVTIYTPEVLDFTRPQTGMEVSFLYRLYPRIRVGVGGGIGLAFFERNRSTSYVSFYTHAIIPMYGVASYTFPIGVESAISLTTKLGFQHHRIAVTEPLIEIRGGRLSGLEASMDVRLLSLPFRFSMGYEIHQYRNRLKLFVFDPNGTRGLDEEDIFDYTTYAKMLQLAIGLKF